MKLDAKLIMEQVMNDPNAELLDDTFDPKFFSVLQVQEGHKKLGPDPKGIPTTLYGLTEKGVKTAADQSKYATYEVPEYIKNAWTILGNEEVYKNEKNRPALDALAQRVSQYYKLGQTTILDGYTNGKFSKMSKMARAATLINYNVSSMYGMRDSLAVEAINNNDEAALARSFYSSGKKDAKGNWITEEDGSKKVFSWSEPSEKRYLHMFNAQMVFMDHIPNKEEYVKKEKEHKVDGNGPVKPDSWNMVDTTLKSISNNIKLKTYNYGGDLYKAPEVRVPAKAPRTVTAENIKVGVKKNGDPLYGPKKLDTPINIPQAPVEEKKDDTNSLNDFVRKLGKMLNIVGD